MSFDLTLFNLIHGLAGKSKILDLLGIFLADYLGYFLIILVLYLIFYQLPVKDWQKRYQYFLFTALALILSRGLFTELIRFFYYRPRPFVALNFTPLINHESAAAFPSGHAAFYFALAFAVWVYDRRWGTIFIIGALLMGIARVASGVHYPFDILGGILVALISLFISKILLNKFYNRTN